MPRRAALAVVPVTLAKFPSSVSTVLRTAASCREALPEISAASSALLAWAARPPSRRSRKVKASARSSEAGSRVAPSSSRTELSSDNSPAPMPLASAVRTRTRSMATLVFSSAWSTTRWLA
ncbi:MAG: hypothetical protein J6333_04435, partial [Planctomycetes bacterium]|nr:hypothetical protein [Planctomycetota bacterium]